MYSVVGCPDCAALKIVADRPETTECPRCGRRTTFETLRTIYQTEEIDAAREVRARMLAQQSGYSEEYAEMEGFSDLEPQTENAGISPEEFLERKGIDTEATDAAGHRATTPRTTRNSRKEIVLQTLRELDQPTQKEIVAHAGEADVPPEYVSDALSKLERNGDVTETNGRYRLL